MDIHKDNPPKINKNRSMPCAMENKKKDLSIFTRLFFKKKILEYKSELSEKFSYLEYHS